jgi:rod shape-determining protein MreD
VTSPWKALAAEGALLVGALLLQQTLVHWIALGSIRPDITLIALTAVALRRGPVAGLYAGMALGLIQDIYAIDTLGAGALSTCLVGYGLGFFEDKVVKSMPATRILLLGSALLAHDIVYYLALGFRGEVFWGSLLRETVPSAVYTLLVGAGVFYFFARFKSRET